MPGDEGIAEIAALKRRFPGWTVWFGLFTGHWWALPPSGSDEEHFVEADSVLGLAARIDLIQRTVNRADPRWNARGPSNLLRLEGASANPLLRAPAVAWPGGTAQ